MLKGAILGLALAAAAGPASALTYTITINGFFDWFDETDHGPAFTAAFKVNTASPNGVTWSLGSTSYAPGTYLADEAEPGTYYLYRDVTWSYAYAIGSSAFNIGRGHEISDNIYDPGWNFIDTYNHQYVGLDFAFSGIEGLIGPDGVPTTQKLGPDSIIEGYYTYAISGFQYYLPDYNQGTWYRYVRGTSYSVSVPEPATWALSIGGFGMAGGALRRSKPVAA